MLGNRAAWRRRCAPSPRRSRLRADGCRAAGAAGRPEGRRGTAGGSADRRRRRAGRRRRPAAGASNSAIRFALVRSPARAAASCGARRSSCACCAAASDSAASPERWREATSSQPALSVATSASTMSCSRWRPRSREIGARHLRGQRHKGIVARCLGGADVGLRRLHVAPHLAEEVELPGGIEARLEQIEGRRRRRARGPAGAGSAAAVDRRCTRAAAAERLGDAVLAHARAPGQPRAFDTGIAAARGGAELRACRGDAQRRLLQVEVLRARCGDEPVEGRIAERRPPALVCACLCARPTRQGRFEGALGRGRPTRRHDDIGAAWLRPDRACSGNGGAGHAHEKSRSGEAPCDRSSLNAHRQLPWADSSG